jgi:hypothetical protein
MTLTPIKVRANGKVRKCKVQIKDGKLDQAFNMFLLGKSALQIGMELKIPVADVKHMARHNGWTSQRNALLNETKPTVQAQLQAVMADNIVKVAQRNLDTAEQLDDHIHVHLAKKKLGTKAIADLSRAALSTAKMAGDIVGLGKATEDAGKIQGPVTWNIAVQVVNNPPPAVPPDPPAINVPSEVK